MGIFWPVDGRRSLVGLHSLPVVVRTALTRGSGQALLSRKAEAAVLDARTAKMTPAQLDGGAWLYSHPRSPKAARSTPAGAYHPPAR